MPEVNSKKNMRRAPLLLGTLHVKAVVGADVSWAAHAADSLQLTGIDLVAVKERFKDMEAQHLANNEDAPTGLVADHNDLMRAGTPFAPCSRRHAAASPGRSR